LNESLTRLRGYSRSMGRKRFVLLLTLVVLAGCALPAEAGATWPGQAGRVAYEALAPTGDGIYSIKPDGTGNRRIIRFRSSGDTAWSRDGKRIAYFRTNEELWQARSDGSHARLIVRLEQAYGFAPAWSANGKRLVFTLAREFEGDDEHSTTTTNDVYVVNRDGTGLRKLASGHDPTWSSRNLIAYASEEGDVVTIRPNGRGRHIWVPQGSPLYVRDLDFSPDGRRLVYHQRPSAAKSTIRTIDLRTGERTRLPAFSKQVRASDVSWAPGGRRLAYLHETFVERGASPPAELRTISPTGKHRRTLFKFPAGASVFSFAWQTVPR
jgi:Tol biopolymer transport system component